MTVRTHSLLYLLSASLFVLLANACTPKYPKCEKDDHCAEKGELCVEGTCLQCRDDSTCAAGQQCKGGRCEQKPECAANTDCAGNKVCRSGKCQIECNATADCGAGLKCAENRCVDELACTATSDCGAGMACVNRRCQQQVQQASRAMGCEFPTVRFPYNEATLEGSVKSGLEKVAECLKQRGGRLVVEGHCDERGTEEYNLALGDRRARAVAEYLKRLGVPANAVEIVSKGETQPLNNSSDENAWSENRRAEFIQQ